MSDRERWIIYPLLFFALVLSAKNWLGTSADGELTVAKIRCNELVATSPSGKPCVRIRGRMDASGQAIFYGAGSKVVTVIGVDSKDATGAVEIRRPDGTTQIMLSSNERGGVIEVFDRQGDSQVQLEAAESEKERGGGSDE